MQHTDAFDNVHAEDLPYARGDVVRSTEDDVRKLSQAWSIVRGRVSEGLPVHNLSGLERGIDFYNGTVPLDDEIAPAHVAEELRRLGLEHLGGGSEHDVVLLNRLTAALFLAAQVLIPQGCSVVGLSPSYSHPAVRRAVAARGAKFFDTNDIDEFASSLERQEDVGAATLTRLAVTYEVMPEDTLREAVLLAKSRDVPIILDDAGGARVGPAIFGQPRSLDLGVDLAATGLDKYGTSGPRLGLLGAPQELASQVHAKAYELGMEARPMLYPAVVQSLAGYSDDKVRELVANTKTVAKELRQLVPEQMRETDVIVSFPGELTLRHALDVLGIDDPPIVPYEATAALAMLLLRQHGILTVHFAGLPPGTSSLLLKFIPTDVLRQAGGPVALAHAFADALEELPKVIADTERLRALLYG